MNRNLRLVAFPLAALLVAGAVWLADRAGLAGAAAPPRAPAPEEGAAPGAELAGAPDAGAPPVDHPLRSGPPSPERRPVAGPGPAVAVEPFRGRLLDEATDEPVAGVVLAAQDARWDPGGAFLMTAPRRVRQPGALELPVGADGRWSHDAPLPADVAALDVLDPLQGTHVRTVTREDLVADPREGWIARIAIGPTFRVDPIGVASFEVAAWEARLVEVARDGVEHAGSWVRLHGGGAAGPPWLRYDNPWRPNAAESRFRVDLRERDGARTGSSALLVGPATGIHPDVVPVPVDRIVAVLSGRVVDSTGRPKDHVRVRAEPLGAAPVGAPTREAREEVTGDDGAFALRGLELGEVRLTASPRRGEPPAVQRVLLDRARVDVGDLVVARLDGAGMVRGRLRSAAGLALATPEHVRLRTLDGRGIELFDVSEVGGGRRDASTPPWSTHTFDFNEVPGGALELSVVPKGGHRWSPASVRVTAPADDVVFVRQDDVPLAGFAFDVVRAGDAAPVDAFDVVVDVAGSPAWTLHDPARGWRDSEGDRRQTRLTRSAFRVPPGVPFRWTVVAPGLRAVTGDERAFGEVVHGGFPTLGDEGRIAFEERETRVARVELSPGFAARLRFRDLGAGHLHDDEHGLVHALEAPRVSGVRVRADGRLVAASADGEAWIELDREPARLDVEAPGWRLVESDAFRNGRLVGTARDVVVWLVRD